MTCIAAKYQVEPREVEAVFVHENVATWRVSTDDGDITTTAAHPFYVEGQGWTPAEELRAGDQLRTDTGNMSTVVSVSATGDTATVHNFTVPGLHNYHVATKDGTWLLVHNANGAGCGLPNDILRLSEWNITQSGDTVLGSYPRYITKANARDASYFDIGETWETLSPSQRTAANNHFLYVIAERGDRVLLSTQKTQIRSGTALADQMNYLTEQSGYRWVNQWSLKPGG